MQRNVMRTKKVQQKVNNKQKKTASINFPFCWTNSRFKKRCVAYGDGLKPFTVAAGFPTTGCYVCSENNHCSGATVPSELQLFIVKACSHSA